ncbi:hypothetical protein CEXT_753761 [Caerostris extrusa]|uniref:Uncharacterized protein n=1 Tax=Caerostris extrusa TaxID=172846 RepID=A0AAV4MLR6_CAEEX|nr:hypothetical protein CEXT_753761 [Caerostris extrusa]
MFPRCSRKQLETRKHSSSIPVQQAQQLGNSAQRFQDKYLCAISDICLIRVAFKRIRGKRQGDFDANYRSNYAV